MQLEFVDSRQWRYIFKMGVPARKWMTIEVWPFGVKSYAATCPFQILNHQVLRVKDFDGIMTWWEQYMTLEVETHLLRMLKLKAFW